MYIWAQAPQAFNYQAIARDAEGNLLIEKKVAVKITLLRGSATGTTVYAESFEVTTGKTGVLNLQIGTGKALTGKFANVDWSLSPYFIRFSMDPAGGTAYKDVATTQMLSVPYALYAERARTVESAQQVVNKDFMVVGDNYNHVYVGANPQIRHGGDLSATIIYLDNEDQQVKFDITGLPAGITVTDRSTPSTKYGRHIEMEFGNVPAEDKASNCKIILKNKQGVTKEFPFILKTVANPNTPSDEEFTTMKKNFLTPLEALRQMDADFDKAFMGKSSDEATKEFKEKSYTSQSSIIYDYWSKAYEAISSANLVITILQSRQSLTTFQQNILAQALVARANCYLLLTLWFDRVPYVTTIGLEAISSPQLARSAILNSVVSDIVNSLALLNDDSNQNISKADADAILADAYMLKGEWGELPIGTKSSSEALSAFYMKVAEKMFASIGEPEKKSLMDEYMADYYDGTYKGNLMLNVLGLSVTYLDLDESNKHRAILPIPQREIDLGSNVTQNPGYNTK